MATTITAGNGTNGGAAVSSDNTGILELKTGTGAGTTAVTIGTDQSVTFAATPTYSGGTANGVAYLNASKALTTGSTLIFDGTSLGIGISPTTRLTVNGGINVIDNFALNLGSNQGGGATLLYNGNGNLDITPRSGYSTVFTAGNVGFGVTNPGNRIALPNNAFIAFRNTSAAEAGYIGMTTGNLMSYSDKFYTNSGGDFLVGTTTNGGVGWTFEAVGYSITKKSGTATTVHISFQNNNGEVGKISTSGTATTYGTSSDYRLKENVQPMSNALAKVAELKPVTYKWKVDGSDGQGFIAHELQSVCPDAVIGEKDAVETYIDDSGTEQTRPVYQAVDTSFLIATLTAAIQELKAELDATKAEVAALKGAAQ